SRLKGNTVLQQLAETLLKQRDRWILWTPVAIAVGVGLYFSLRTEPPLWLGLVMLAVLLAPLPAFYKNKLAVLAWLPFFLVALGFAAAEVRTWQVSAPVLERRTYPLFVEGRVAAVDVLPEGHRMVLDQLRYETDYSLPQDPMPEKVRLKLKK